MNGVKLDELTTEELTTVWMKLREVFGKRLWNIVDAYVCMYYTEFGGIMKTWTIEEMVAERLCSIYIASRIKKLWAGRDALSLLDICKLDISAKDRLWACFRPNAMSLEIRQLWLKKITDRIVTANALACGIPDVESWAKKWISGEDMSARSAAESSEYAAWSAARSAAESSEYAAWSAARSAEEQTQISELIGILEVSK